LPWGGTIFFAGCDEFLFILKVNLQLNMSRFFVDPDISVAQTIDTSVYNSPRIFEEITGKIFVPCWQFAGTAGRLPENSSCYPLILLQRHHFYRLLAQFLNS